MVYDGLKLAAPGAASSAGALGSIAMKGDVSPWAYVGIAAAFAVLGVVSAIALLWAKQVLIPYARERREYKIRTLYSHRTAPGRSVLMTPEIAPEVKIDLEQAAEFKIYRDKAGEYRWRLQAKNNAIIAKSNGGYKTKTSCLHGIDIVKGIATSSTVNNRTT